MDTKQARLEWRCERCGKFLGDLAEDRVRASYRGAQYVILGDSYAVVAVCPICGMANPLAHTALPPTDQNQGRQDDD